MNKPSLVKAVTDLLKFEYLPNHVKFSAHDVTSRLRELVLQQGVIGGVYPIDVAEVGTVMVQGQRVAKIEHSDVKQIIHTLFETGELPGYTREDNGTFFEYAPDASLDMTGTLTGRMSSNQPGTSIPREDDPIGPSTGPWSTIS